MAEIVLPGDIKAGVATGLLAKDGTLLLNLEGDSPEDIANDPNTPKQFQDLSVLEVLRPEIKEVVNGKPKLELPAGYQATSITEIEIPDKTDEGSPQKVDTPTGQRGAPELERFRAAFQDQRVEEHSKLERLHADATGAKLYQPYYPTQQKAMRKQQEREAESKIYESSTDNDYLSVIESKRHRYIKDKLLVKDLGAKVRDVLLHPELDPDFEISQATLSQLLQKGVID